MSFDRALWVTGDDHGVQMTQSGGPLLLPTDVLVSSSGHRRLAGWHERLERDDEVPPTARSRRTVFVFTTEQFNRIHAALAVLLGLNWPM